MPTVTELLSILEREHVLQALEQLDAGEKISFAESTKCDVVYKGKHYAPKGVTLLQGGSPATPDDLRKRFDTFMSECCKGKDASKLRFVVG